MIQWFKSSQVGWRIHIFYVFFLRTPNHANNFTIEVLFVILFCFSCIIPKKVLYYLKFIRSKFKNYQKSEIRLCSTWDTIVYHCLNLSSWQWVRVLWNIIYYVEFGWVKINSIKVNLVSWWRPSAAGKRQGIRKLIWIKHIQHTCSLLSIAMLAYWR